MRKLVFALVLVLALSSVALADNVPSKIIDVPAEVHEIAFWENVPFAEGVARGSLRYTLYMDVFQPKVKEKCPLIVFVTGGGFIMAPRNNLPQIRMRLAQAGYVVASIEYRVAPLGRFPQPLEDVKTAIRWLRAHADKFNIDPERVGVLGNSAGGYLSAFTGITNGDKTFDKGEYLDYSSDVLCAVDLYGLSDLTVVGADYDEKVQAEHKSAGATEALWVIGALPFGGKDGGVLAPENKELVDYANPINHISEKSAPMLLMHGDADMLVSPSQTDLIFQALQAKGIESERYIVKNAQHGGAYWVQEPVMKIVVDFYDKYLKK